MDKKEVNIFEKMLEGIKRLVNIGEKHKEISEKTYNKSLSKREQRIWYSVTIIVMIILGTGIIINLAKDSENMLEVSVSPNKIILNHEGNIDFEIKFTNTGKENLENFDVFGIDLYRKEAENLTYKSQIVSRYDSGRRDYSISCTGRSNNDLVVGKSCTVKAEMSFCQNCFDDKDKEIYLFIYIKSSPPTENQIVNIPIY